MGFVKIVRYMTLLAGDRGCTAECADVLAVCSLGYKHAVDGLLALLVPPRSKVKMFYSLLHLKALMRASSLR